MTAKRGQGLSMTTIVIAAMALLVLVVLVLIFTGRMSIFSTGVQESNKCQTFCQGLGMTAVEGYDFGTTTVITGTGGGSIDSYCKSLDQRYVPAIENGDYNCCCS